MKLLVEELYRFRVSGLTIRVWAKDLTLRDFLEAAVTDVRLDRTDTRRMAMTLADALSEWINAIEILNDRQEGHVVYVDWP